MAFGIYFHFIKVIGDKLVTAVIRFCLDFKATPNEKSYNCC